MRQSSFDLRASKERVIAAFDCLLAYVLDAGLMAGSQGKPMVDQALIELKEKVIAEALFHDLMVEADAVARCTSVH